MENKATYNHIPIHQLTKQNITNSAKLYPVHLTQFHFLTFLKSPPMSFLIFTHLFHCARS